MHDKIYEAYWFTVASFAKVFTVAFTRAYKDCSPSYCVAYCQCCHRLLCKNRWIHKFTRPEQNSLDLNSLRRRSQFSLIMIWLFALSPKKLDIICAFVEIDDAEAWKISFQQSSGFFQELKMTPLGTYGSINLTFSHLFLVQWSCKEMKKMAWPTLKQQTARKWNQ